MMTIIQLIFYSCVHSATQRSIIKCEWARKEKAKIKTRQHLESEGIWWSLRANHNHWTRVIEVRSLNTSCRSYRILHVMSFIGEFTAVKVELYWVNDQKLNLSDKDHFNPFPHSTRFQNSLSSYGDEIYR
jgi:hypothetical protein